jgi:hypothetical protein
MAFVKLDSGILSSTIWVDREAREVFITALLMATPFELSDPTPQLEVRSLDPTGFVVPPGWYGFVPVAGTGIVRMAGIELEAGLDALERLGAPDLESRTTDFDGRRLVRVEGGYIALNFDRYRQKDHTSPERSKRYRDRKRHAVTSRSSRVTSRSSRVTGRSVTQAEAEAYKSTDQPCTPPVKAEVRHSKKVPFTPVKPARPSGDEKPDPNPTAAPPKPRPRNPLLDALATHAEASDPHHIPPKRWATIATAGAQIVKADPTVTPEEIATRCDNYRTHFPDLTLTAPALATHWARCAKPKQSDRARPRRVDAQL